MIHLFLYYMNLIHILGLIQNATDEVVSRVEDLVVSYVKGDSLILVTLPMTGESFSIHSQVNFSGTD
jgi:hypothetical protein